MQKGSCKALPNPVKLNEEDSSYGHEVMMTISLPSGLMNKVFNAHTYPGLLFLHCKQEHCIDLIEYLSVMATIPPCPFDTCVRFYAILGGRAEK